MTPSPADPYQAPSTQSKDPPGPLPAWSIAISLGSALAVAAMAMLVVPEFEDVYRNFGAQLPVLSNVLVHHPGVTMGWPLIVAMLALAWRKQRARTTALVLLSAVGSFLVFVLMVALLYLPIFQLAATI